MILLRIICISVLFEYGGRVVQYKDYNSWTVNPDGDGYLYYESDCLNVHSGVDYHFLYSSNIKYLFFSF